MGAQRKFGNVPKIPCSKPEGKPPMKSPRPRCSCAQTNPAPSPDSPSTSTAARHSSDYSPPSSNAAQPKSAAQTQLEITYYQVASQSIVRCQARISERRFCRPLPLSSQI